ncbi:MAG TPA: hypothetical protein VGE52_06550 [Pirellulales bacterium]
MNSNVPTPDNMQPNARPPATQESLPADPVEPSPADSVNFDVFFKDAKGVKQFVGVVRMDRVSGRLKITESAPAQRLTLERGVAAVNAEASVRQRIPPRGMRRFALASRPVERGSPDFPEAVRDYLHRFYGLELD